MRVRAIQDLAQLPDSAFFEQVAEGLRLCVSNAEAILEDARQLVEAKRPRGAAILKQAADEEASKVLVLLDAVRCPRLAKSAEFSRQLQYFNEHLAKGIYSEIVTWRPADFAEVRAGVDRERKEFYLDGPNGVDWILYNDVLRRREEAIYVSYVENDGGHLWHDPGYLDELRLSEPLRSRVVGIAQAFMAAGCLSTPALSEIANQWRAVEINDVMDWVTLRDLNHSTLERLNGLGLLARASEDHYSMIVNGWPFPMYPLDLRIDRVKKESLREIREQWSPYGDGP